MPKSTKSTKTSKSRVKVKDLSNSEKKLTGKDMKKVKGGAVDMFLKLTRSSELK